MSTAAVYSSQQGPKFNQRVLRGKLIEKQETLNLFINNVFYGVDLTILSDKVKIVKPRPKTQTPKAQPQPSQIQSKSVPRGLGLTLKS